MARKLYAKDRNRQLNRRVGTVVLGALGAAGLYLLGKWAWGIVHARPMDPGTRPDWSGCGPIPDDVNPKPMYECGQEVQVLAYYVDASADASSSTGEKVAVKIVNRTWTSAGNGWMYGISKGMGLYNFAMVEDGQIEESAIG